MNSEKIKPENQMLLNKKRQMSKSKVKRRKHPKKILDSKYSKPGTTKLIQKEKTIEQVKEDFRHFFHINWEHELFSKDIQRISQNMTGIIYWFLIDSSYFIEDNIQV